MPLTQVSTGVIANRAASAAKAGAGVNARTVHASYAIYASTTAQIPTDNTEPLISEGTEILSASITPLASTNRILCIVNIPVLTSSTGDIVVALFRGSTCIGSCVSPGFYVPASIVIYDNPATTSPTTYSVRVGRAGASGTVYINGSTSAQLFNGVPKATLTLQEVVA